MVHTITPEATKQIEALCAEEISLQQANLWYWKQEYPTPKDGAEYKGRRDRLDDIRRKLVHLRVW